MDPISAFKMMSLPDMGAKLSGIAQDATKSIPLNELQKLNSDLAPQTIGGTQGVGATQGAGSFDNLLTNFVGEVNAKQAAAGDAVSGLMSGKNVSLHQAMISMEEANVSFQMMVEVRNNLLSSYQELMRMQI